VGTRRLTTMASVGVRSPMKQPSDRPIGRPTQRVVVTKRVHGSSALDPTLKDGSEATTSSGPRYDDAGHMVPHSILGSKDEYVAAAGYDPTQSGSSATTRHASVDLAAMPTARASAAVAAAMNPDHPSRIWPEGKEKRQLNRWTEAARDWERQESDLAAKLGRAPAELMMNSEAQYRRVKEKREQVDITLSDPSAMRSFEKGHGYRVRSEYWAQPNITKSGLQTTLTMRQRGLNSAPESFTYVSKPASVLDELHQAGRPAGAALDRTIPFFRTSYIQERGADLREAVEQLFPHEPDVAGLEVVGRAILSPDCLGFAGTVATSLADEPQADLAVDTDAHSESVAVAESTPRENAHEAAHHASVQPGPHLKIVGTDETRGGGATRVHFQTSVGAAEMASLVLENRGTTALIVSWHKVEAPNALGKVEDNAQRFFFDHRPVTILPGERRALPVQFRSRVGGMFLETWAASVLPSVGADCEVCFCGTAIREDEFQPAREAVEAALEKALMRRAIADMLHTLITRIHPRNHEAIFGAPPPTLEERFMKANAALAEREGWTFCDRIVRDLQLLYRRVIAQEWATSNVPQQASAHDGADAKGARKEEIADEVRVPDPDEWDLSVSGLRKTILDMTDWDFPSKLDGHTWHRAHEYLAELNAHVVALSRKKARDLRVDRRVVAREFVAAMMSAVEDRCVQARFACGLKPMPLVVAEEVAEEEYVPRIQISPPVKGAKKGKPPAKDDKKKKPERAAQGKPAEPLDEETAAALAPIQYAMAREAVVSALDDLDTLLPLCE